MHKKGKWRISNIFFPHSSPVSRAFFLFAAWNTNTVSSLSNLLRSWYTSNIQFIILFSHVRPKFQSSAASYATCFWNRRQKQMERMKNLKTDKIYLSLSNLNNVDFPISARNTGEMRWWFHQYYLLLYYGKAGWGEKKRTVKRVSVKVLQYLESKAMRPAQSLLLLKCHSILGSWQ